MTTLNAVSSFSGTGQTSVPPQPSIEALARRGDGAELRAFVAERPDMADALRTELARVNVGALFELEAVIELPTITVTASRPQPQDDGKGWLADRLDDLRGFVQAHDGSEVIADAGDWVGGQIDRIRSDVPVVSQAASVTRGVLGFGKDLVQGVVSLPGLVVNGAVARVQTDVALLEGRTTPGQLVDQTVAVVRAIPGAIAAPVAEAWQRGDHLEAVTRGITEVATLPLAPAKAGVAVRLADVAADGARVVDVAGDVARAADAAGDAGRIGGQSTQVTATSAANRLVIENLGIPTTLSPRQSLHLPPVTDGRSVLTTDPVELLNDLHDGAFTVMRQPRPGQVIVDFGKPIGDHWSQGSFVGETRFGSVLYGRNGTHIVPANPHQW